jgi:hypothetical protein
VRSTLRSGEPKRSRIRRVEVCLAGALIALPLLAAAPAPAPRGDPASRLADTDTAAEYWDFVALFDSNYKLFARFEITNEGPGKRTGIAYGHFVEPDGTTRFFGNVRLEGRWQLGPHGLRMKVGGSALDMTSCPYAIRVHKKKKGVDIDLHFTPDGPAAWDAEENGEGPWVDLLAAGAPIEGSVWFRGMPAPVELSGRVGWTHTWTERSETDLVLRRIDFFSLRGDPLVYLRESEAPDGSRSRWLAIFRGGKIIHQSNDFELSMSGRSSAQDDSKYPLPATLRIRDDAVEGQIHLGVGLVHYSPMEDVPQPFRFLLSFRMRPHRVWTDSPFEVTLMSSSDRVKIRGSGIAAVTFLNPISLPTSKTPPPTSGE